MARTRSKAKLSFAVFGIIVDKIEQQERDPFGAYGKNGHLYELLVMAAIEKSEANQLETHLRQTKTTTNEQQKNTLNQIERIEKKTRYIEC